MTIIKQIGRYEIPITQIALIEKRSGLKAWLLPGYDVTLNNGKKIRLSEEEKVLLDSAQEDHAIVMQVYGMARSCGLRG